MFDHQRSVSDRSKTIALPTNAMKQEPRLASPMKHSIVWMRRGRLVLTAHGSAHGKLKYQEPTVMR
jgi:hypothetical protein